MKKRKIVITVLISFAVIACLFLHLFVYYCLNRSFKFYYGLRPWDEEQIGYSWISEDGNICFTIIDSYGTGEMTVNGKTIEIVMGSVGNGATIEINKLEEREKEVMDFPFEKWQGYFHHKDRFTVKVLKTTYLEVGQEIKFYRIDHADAPTGPEHNCVNAESNESQSITQNNS